MLFYILVGLVLGASANISSGAGAITLTEVEQKLATLEKELASLKQKQSNSEKKFVKVQNELEYGGKRYQTLQYTNSKYSCVVAVVAIVSLITLCNLCIIIYW